MLYCIKCEKMTFGNDPDKHVNTVQVSNSQDPGSRWDLEECNFPLGFATCPPPDFDLDEYIETHGAPPAVIESDFLPYTYSVELDEILVEVL